MDTKDTSTPVNHAKQPRVYHNFYDIYKHKLDNFNSNNNSMTFILLISKNDNYRSNENLKNIKKFI